MHKTLFFILLLGVFSQPILSQSHFLKSVQNWDGQMVQRLNNRTIPENSWIAPYTNSVIYLTAASPFCYAAIPLFEKEKYKNRKWAYEVGAGVTGIVLNNFLTYHMKKSVGRSRPFDQYPDQIFPAYRPTDKSFPSGHTSGAFQWATSVVMYSRFHYGKSPVWLVVPVYAYATSIAVSRMVMGVHYPTDVTAGAVLGSLSAWASWKLTSSLYHWNENKKKKLPSDR